MFIIKNYFSLEMELSEKSCDCVTGKVEKLSSEGIEKLLEQVQEWKIVDNHHLQKSYKFSSYLKGMQFVDHLVEIAEEQNHHPRIIIDYRKVTVEIYTHVVDGLSDNDFILAAKYDALRK